MGDTVTHAMLLEAITDLSKVVSKSCERIGVLETRVTHQDARLSEAQQRIGKLENGVKELPVIAAEQKWHRTNWDRVWEVMKPLLIAAITVAVFKALP